MSQHHNAPLFEPLLELGPPHPDVIHTMVQGLDEELDQNRQQIQECVRELLKISSEQSGPDRSFNNPADALQFLAEERVLENQSCVDPDADVVARLLQHQLDVLEQHPGAEDAVLQQVLRLSSQQGIALPVRASMMEHTSQSCLSINTALDDTEQMTEALWDRLSRVLRKRYLQRLNHLPVASPSPALSDRGLQRLKCVQSMAVLFPDVWGSYSSMRTQHVNKIIDKHMRRVGCFHLSAEAFSYVTEKLLVLVTEDYDLINTGVFGSQPSVISAIYQLYYEPLLDEVSSIVEQLQCELPSKAGSPKRKSSAGSRRSAEVAPEVLLPKSPSEQGSLLGQMKTNLRRQHSSSLDSLISRAEDPFTELQNLSPFALDPLAKFVSCLLRLEQELLRLQSSMIWEILGSTRQSKKDLRSALKASCKISRPMTASEYSRAIFTGNAEAIPPPFGATQAMISEPSGLFRVEERQSDDLPRWQWRCLFRKIMPELAKSLEHHLQSVAATQLFVEWDALEHGTRSLQSAPVDRSLVGGRLDYPPIISKGLQELAALLGTCVTLALAGSDGCFVLLRSSFVDTVVLIFKNLAFRIAKVNDRCITPSDLCLVLASAAFVRNILMFYENVLGLEEASKRPLSTLYKQFCELVEALAKQTVEMHTYSLQTFLLHDAESLNWNDSKDFFEGERCSFPVQMWRFHLRAIRRDLWQTCPPQLAQSMFAAVLDESLNMLARRYASVNPSHARLPQFRADIVYLLLSTSDLLLSACDSLSSGLEPSSNQKELRGIHNACCHLLAILAYVCCPLDVLSQFLAGSLGASEADEGRGSLSQWLRWLRPTCFSASSLDQLQTTSALQLQVQLLHDQPQKNFAQLLQALLMKDCTLSILIATQVANDLHHSIDLQSDVISCLVHVLVSSDQNFPDALARVILPVIERTDSWELFDTKSVIGKEAEIPVWLKCIFKQFDSFVIKSVGPAIRVLAVKQSEQETADLSSVCDRLPCGCDWLVDKEYAFRDDHVTFLLDLNDGNRDVMAEALYTLISHLSCNVFNLPVSLMTFLRCAEDNLDQKGVSSPHACVALKVPQLSLPSADNQSIRTAVFQGSRVYSGKPIVPGSTSRLNRSKHTFQTSRYSYRLFDLVEGHSSASAEFKDTLMSSVVADIQKTSSGQVALEKLHNLLMHNIQWLSVQLDWTSVFPSEGRASRDVALRLDVSEAPCAPFNPLSEYSSLGDSKFSQARLLEWQPDWGRLVQSDLGVSQVGVTALVQNREEFSESSHLTSDQRLMVERICSFLNISEPDSL
ncbi:hypothetical protein CAPTEDRAFT_227345 [Capitella teleta]|uniref:Uncharacterized protein n=1 Tax=Capitella teleta TaxID=283909 RepID=R7T8W2_CAPTE|nr:hypothetical protein CAPTEDRAFT_227345 [Capitella teleta]|eukprot:ELT90139.1 hypothetical protein CAPTEDRAFT_227345 [Capitella teleta]